jgi:flavin-dependent dehydrogenase
VTGLISSADRVTRVRGRRRGGAEIADQARIVIGADGRNWPVAKAVGAAEYNARPVLTCACYAYWRDVTLHVPAIRPRARRVVTSFPTNDGLTVTPAVFPREELPAVRASLERHLSDALGLVGDFAEPFRRSARVERIRAMSDLPNFFRKPYGDGWALVGDGGYHKDPILAQGISDAFRSSEWVADASMPDFPARGRSTRRWPNISAFATSTSRRCTI